MRLTIIALLAAMSSPALAADQFDLACQGTRISKHDGPAEPYSFPVRVDLAAKQWCMGACEKALPINAVQPGKIVLADDLIYNTSSDFSNSVTLDPKSYAFRQLSSQDRPTTMYLKVDATCTLQPFTPLPAPK